MILYEDIDNYVSKGTGRRVLPILYNMARLAPNAALMFEHSPGIGITHRLVIPASSITAAEVYGYKGRWDDQTDPRLGPFGSDARKAQELAADRVFVDKGDEITISVTAPTAEEAYSLYAHASYYVARQKLRWTAHRLFVAGEPEYYAPP
jgi:hypothetical protein